MSRTANPQHRLRRSGLLRWLVVCAAMLVASFQPAGILDPKGPIASAERLLLINATAIMLVVVVPVILATLAFAWWYRSSNPRASRSPDPGYEGRLEFVVWSIPALTVILLSGVIWIGSHQLDPRAPIPARLHKRSLLPKQTAAVVVLREKSDRRGEVQRRKHRSRRTSLLRSV